jgi:hypothetical protein
LVGWIDGIGDGWIEEEEERRGRGRKGSEGSTGRVRKVRLELEVPLGAWVDE